MKITTVLFDLDGTLLPMEQEDFVKVYFGSLAKKLAPYGYEISKRAQVGATIGAHVGPGVYGVCYVEK